MAGPAAKSVLLLDISRLIWRARRRSPTGIDRVELAYAQHFLSADRERPAYAVLHLFGFLFAVSRDAGGCFIEQLAVRWQGSASTTRQPSIISIYFRLLSSAWFFGFGLRRELRRYPGSPIFLVVSHHHLAYGHTIDRIRRSLKARTACFIHDLIPIEYPEYFEPGWEERYWRLSGNIGRLFDAVIANSESTARSVRAYSEKQEASRATVRIAAPGVHAFPQPQKACTTERDRPYFAVLGTIEPRKNHLLLLNLWSRLASTVAVPPRLLVIGARGWENEQVLDMLERSRRLRGLVEEHNGLSDAEVGSLLTHARAVLLPSFVEGFGLPLAEALASGLPALCSDIPAFREVGRDVPEYLDPLDLPGWADAVLDYTRPDSVRRATQMRRLSHWRAPRWADHFTVVEQLLGDLDTGQYEVLPANAYQAL
jgi:glycosyltransferase involved in cell wall biosynthesis